MKQFCDVDIKTGAFIKFGYWNDLEEINIEGNWIEIDAPSGLFKPFYNKETNEWIETATPDEIVAMKYGVEDVSEVIKLVKESKINDLKSECNQRIVDGFTLDGKRYSYSQEKQINFQDTFQLFSNNIITEITWNVYINNEKQRIKLNKEQFQKVYLAGIKHKTDILSRLNDVLIPMVVEAKNKETVARIYWDEGLDSPEISMKEDKTLEKQIDSLSKTTQNIQSTSMTTMLALVQVSNMIGK